MLFLFMLLVSVVGCFVEWVEELCVNYVKNCPKLVQKISKLCLGGVSERSWELLGHPWGLKVGPRVDFDGFLEHFRLPFWMFPDKKSVLFRRYFLTSFYVGLGISFGAFCAQCWMLF